MEYQQRMQDRSKQSVVDQSFSYANSLKASRKKTEESNLEKKKLQYNFKKISSQIVRSKNSISARKAEVQENTTRSMDEMTSDMMKMMSDTMEEMTEELDLTELASTMVAPDSHMSEDDLKMLKMKHRTKEMKEIAKADGDYLKAIMDKYDKKGIAGLGILLYCCFTKLSHSRYSLYSRQAKSWNR